MNKNNSNPWGQSEDLVAQQLAWGASRGAARDLSSPEASPGETPNSDPEIAVRSKSDSLGRPWEADQLELHAIVGPGTSFHGTLSFSGRVRIEGEFAGQILGGKTLIIGHGARVQGEIRAQRVIILGGNVKADIYASEGIELYVPAQVAGDLQAPEIHMDRGVKFQGTCDLTEPA